MKYVETGTLKKRIIVHPRVFRGAACTLLRVSLHPRPLPTVVLARATGELPKHNHASASSKSRDVFGTGDFNAS